MENKKIITSVNTAWLGEDGIARVTHVPGADVMLVDAQETMTACLELNKGERWPLFIDIKNLKAFTREARKYYAGKESLGGRRSVSNER